MRHLLVPLLAASLSPLAFGQTVWRAADGPRTITGTYTVPAGSSLTIEAGVIVRISSNSRLIVNGTLNANGTPTAPVKFIGADNYSALLTVSGTLDMKYGDVGAQTQTMEGGSLVFTDTKFTGVGMLGSSPDYYVFTRTPYVGLTRCSFVGPQANLYISQVILNLRQTTFTAGAWGNVSYGYVILDGVQSDSAPNTGLSFGTDHPLYINHVTVTNAGGPGLNLGAGNWGTNHFIGPDNTFAGNQYPLSGGGFLPGSTVPVTGNVNNRVLFGPTGDFRGGMTLPALAVPYEVNGVPTNYGGTLTMLPGARFKMAPNSQFRIDVGGFRVRGRKGNPVVFERLDPTQAWTQIHFNHHNEVLSNLVVDGSLYGVNGGDTYIDNALFRNNGTATMGGAMSQWSTFEHNGLGYEGDRPQTPGNSFLSNTVAVRATGFSTVDARNNWWVTAAGPAAGQLQGSVFYQPFLIASPSTNDAPYITLNRIEEGLRPGDRFTITWKSEDDAAVVSHRILFSPAGNWPANFTPVATVSGSQQAYEWTVPDIGPQGLTDPGYVRVVAVDAAGRERYDEVAIRINAAYVTGEVTFTTPLVGKVFQSGDRMSLSWTHTLNSNYGVETFVFADGYGMFPMGGGFANYGVWDHIQMPMISTNRARIGMRVGEGPNRYKWFFTPYFSIRPDARIGDAPPTITAAATSVVAPGSPVNLTWTASDDEAVRSYEMHASFDGGRTWHEIEEEIPGSATSTTWTAAPGTGFPNALFRVVVIDQRFQRTASADMAVRIGSGTVVAPSLSGFTLNATSVVGGTSLQGTVTLSAAAPMGGAVVTLASSSSVTAVPASITVPAGSTTATFTVTTQTVSANTTATLSASYSGLTKTASLSVTPAALGGLTLSLASVTGGGSTQGTVTLTGAAPAGGLVVNLTSGNVAVTVPASVTVTAGAKTATFTASTKTVTTSTGVTLTATQGAVSRSATLTVNPAAVTDTVAIQRAEFDAGKRTIRLDATSTSAGASLKVYVSSTGALIGSLSSSGSGRYSGTLSVTTNPGSITVKSSLGGSATRTVTVK